ncbi:carbohydrate kinase [Desulfoluna sp.]|uniref:carbohydrate kinase family protein n=1 Tax=Desulfoluna sp. TaxID=2045199 RepID=UPI002616946B|nr:carbohydrate kinase [Desulfoluna sp.]
MNPTRLCIFGEVLFDCFTSGEQVLGGAPFNVAWHAQALGDRPHFISRVGTDPPGRKILGAMRNWQLDIRGIQLDPAHQTGRVEVKEIGNEPSYEILPQCAYDFIETHDIDPLPRKGILYHGTLGLRHCVSRQALTHLAHTTAAGIFLDVNLRPPWWRKEEVYPWLHQARWVKLNLDELRLLGFTSANIRHEMGRFQTEFQLDQLILTQGDAGALVRTAQGVTHQIVPEKALRVVDSVGAGDAFSAVYIHGLLAGWSIPDTLSAAQRLAGKIIGLRGAITTDTSIYQDFRGSSG